MSSLRDSQYGHRESSFRWLPIHEERMLRASIFPPRTGPPMRRLDRALSTPLSQELQKLRTGLLADPDTEATTAAHATGIPNVEHTYNTAIAKLGGLQVIAWLGESYVTERGQKVAVADSLSLMGEDIAPEAAGAFIFRGGDGFSTAGEIDFQAPAESQDQDGSGHHGDEARPLVAATSAQLIAFTAELIMINQPILQ